MNIVITGATKGIGKEILNLYKDKNNVIYSLSRTTKVNELNTTYLSCDVSKIDEVKMCADIILKEVDHIDLLVVNAGMGIAGSIEGSLIDNIKKLYDVNLFGAINVTKVFLESVRTAKGKIIYTSSLGAEFDLPFQTFYSSSKAALTSFALGLRNEVRPLGVKVCCILPNDTKTDFTSQRHKEDDLEVYKIRAQKSLLKMEQSEQNGISAKKVAKKLYKISLKKNPKPVYTITFTDSLLLFLKRILPRKLISYLMYKIYG